MFGTFRLAIKKSINSLYCADNFLSGHPTGIHELCQSITVNLRKIHLSMMDIRSDHNFLLCADKVTQSSIRPSYGHRNLHIETIICNVVDKFKSTGLVYSRVTPVCQWAARSVENIAFIRKSMHLKLLKKNLSLKLQLQNLSSYDNTSRNWSTCVDHVYINIADDILLDTVACNLTDHYIYLFIY